MARFSMSVLYAAVVLAGVAFARQVALGPRLDEEEIDAPAARPPPRLIAPSTATLH